MVGGTDGWHKQFGFGLSALKAYCDSTPWLQGLKALEQEVATYKGRRMRLLVRSLICNIPFSIDADSHLLLSCLTCLGT